MWWGIEKPHQFKETVFFPRSSQKMVFLSAWMHDIGLRHRLPISCPGLQSPSCQHCLVLRSCPALLWTAPTNSILDIQAIKEAHPNHSGCKSTAILDFRSGMKLGLLLFTGQKSPRLTILVLICYCTFYLWWAYVADPAHLQLQKTGKTKMPSYALYPL